MLSSPCHCAALRKATRRVTQLYDTSLAPSGLTVSQFSLLAELSRREAEPPTMGELARAMVMDRSTLGHNLRPLERDRLVQLVPGKEDRRSRRIRLTKTGRTKLERTRPLWKEAQASFESAFGAKSAAALRNELLKLAALP